MSETTQKQQGNGKYMPLSTLPPEVSAYMQNAQLMQQIVQQMKEIPVLASEKPTDTNALLKVEFPEEGGVLTYMENHPYPYRGFPYFEFVDKIDVMKKLSRNSLSGFYHSVKKRKLTLIFLFPLVFVARDLLTTGVRTFHKLIERFRIKNQLYSKAVRGLYQAFDTPRENESLEILELRMMLKDVICSVLEFDNAYRFRLQDIVLELNKEAIKKNTSKELLRLLNMMSEREKTQEIRDTWRLVKMGVKYYLRFDRQLSKMIRDILVNLDLEQIAMMLDDKHFAAQRYDYQFGFMSNPTVEDQSILDRVVLSKAYLKEREKFDDELAKEFNLQQSHHNEEQSKLGHLSPEIQKEIQEKVVAVQKECTERHANASKEVYMSYLNQKQKDLLKKQEEEKTKLTQEHDQKRRNLAAQYGL